MMNLLAGAFGGFMALFGGLFGHHTMPANNGHMASSTSGWMASSTMDHGRMGSTTPDHRGMGMPGVIGKVATINGTTLTVTGRSGMNSATTTYTVDASAATVFKNQATSSVSAIATGDMVVVSGTVSGTDITAKTIFDGVLQRMMGMGGNHGGKPPVQK